jgi:hypothetical protein
LTGNGADNGAGNGKIELPLAPFKYDGHVFFATPSYDPNVCVDYLNSMLRAAVLLTSAGVKMEHYVHAGDIFIDKARNSIVEAFLDSTATDLFFVDADVGFDARVIPRILLDSHLVVGGLVPKRDKYKEQVYHMNAITGIMEGGLMQSLEIPTAFVRIKREVFSMMKKPWYKIGASESDFGEDIYFCRKLRQLGEFCWIDSDISFSHRGTKAWTGNFYEHAIAEGFLVKADEHFAATPPPQQVETELNPHA